MSDSSNKKQTLDQLKDIDSGKIVKAGGAIGILIVVSMLLIAGFARLVPIYFSEPSVSRTYNPPQPMQFDQMTLNELHSQEKKLLESYGWTDRDNSVVHIPIERAINLKLERGFPTRDQMNSPTLAQEMATGEGLL